MIIIGNIKTIEDWFLFAPPKGGEKHWKDGRSAKELAKYFINANGNLPCEISEMVNKYNSPMLDYNCFPERKTKFDMIKGEPRNHDMVMVAKESHIICIEAKADEPFGETVELEWEKASDNKRKRIYGLARNLFGKDTVDDNIKPLRYQLLTAIAGTVAEAKIQKIKTAVFLVLVLKKNGCYSDEKIMANKQDYDDLLKILENQCKQPLHLPGYKCISLYTDYIEVTV